MINLLNRDCMDYMRELKDKEFDLAIVDPPYGISYARGKNGWGVNDNRPKLSDVKWDNKTPNKNYFDELFRVSKEQIIWGGNYFTDKIPVSKSWIVWDKVGNSTNNKSVFSDADLAWTSFNKVVRIFRLRTMGFITDTDDTDRIHPTQKPSELYKWILGNYAKENDKILDTHGGSMSIAIACHQMGFDLTLCEIDKDYFEAGKKRFENAKLQQTLFNYND